MKYRKYTTGIIDVSEIGIGAWQLGQNTGWDEVKESEAIDMVYQALDKGINFFDTAPNYGLGTSEERLGKALKSIDRQKVVINTKFGHTVNGTTNFSPDHIRESLEGSLRRLDMDYVDSLIIHNPPSNHFDGSKYGHYEILDTLKAEGKIKAYGASLDTYQDLQLLLSTTNSKVVEVFFNILHQDVRRGFEEAKAKDVALIVKVPLDSGWLSGKYNAESTFSGIRSRWSHEDIKIRAEIVEDIKGIVGINNKLVNQALAYCLGYEAISTVIPGSLKKEQLETNLESIHTKMSSVTLKKLEALYEEKIKPLRIPW